jgi:hypothetical protein
MRRIPLIWRDEQVGTIEVPDSFRMPITQAELDAIPTAFFVRSRSWLFDVRQGDVVLQLRGDAGREEVVAVASHRIGPGDIGCIVSFVAGAGHEDVQADEEMIALADQLLKEQRG